jgi:hypothetical protein
MRRLIAIAVLAASVVGGGGAVFEASSPVVAANCAQCHNP